MAISTRVGRFSGKEFRASVAHALLHLGDITALDDSPLAMLPTVRKRAAGSTRLFAEGQALSDTLQEIVGDLRDRLAGPGTVAMIRATLEGVAHYESIASIARRHGKTREHWSRHYWKMAVILVADEIASLNRDSDSRYTNSRVRKPSP